MSKTKCENCLKKPAMKTSRLIVVPQMKEFNFEWCEDCWPFKETKDELPKNP